MPANLVEIYQARVIAGELSADPAQADAARVLQKLAEQLNGYKISSGLLAKLFGKSTNAPKGIYMYGDVGRGKSMLMDLFFDSVSVEKKRRVHFHQFMLEVHDRLHEYQESGASVDGVLPRLAQDIARETHLLCFDEFFVNNIADAMILGRLFQALFDKGVVVFITTNWPPDQLYKNGLQRDRFLPFIEILKQRLEVYHLAGKVDHRMERWRGQQNYFTPLDAKAAAMLKITFNALTDQSYPVEVDLPVQGRHLKIERTAKGVAWCGFGELCGQALGAADYLAIAICFHTVLIEGVPQFIPELRNEAIRFTTLIDALYEAKVKIFISAAAAPDQLCKAPELAFAFERTASRLMEMQAEDYRLLPHLGS